MGRALSGLMATVVLAAAAEKRPVTIADAAATPAVRAGSGAVTWSPDGERFAFREGETLWMYEVATRVRKEVVSLAALREKAVPVAAPEAFEWQNRRVTESDYQWTPDGARILVAASGDLFLVEVDSGKWDQLTATAEGERDPKLSPDGRLVAFRRAQDLYCLDIASRKARRLTRTGSKTLLNGQLDWVYPEELKLGTAFWWSPDSSRIAYLQFDISQEPQFPHADILATHGRAEPQHYPQAGDPNAEVRVGVVAAAGGPTRWMDLGETRDTLLARVAWTPDSKSLAVQRLPRVQNRLDLLLANAATGVASLLLREQDPYWINVSDDLRFLTARNQFLWSSERDGFRHLYLYSNDGKMLRQLTHGDWEVTGVVGVDEALGSVYFLSTAESPLERHLYRVGLDGKLMKRITNGAGMHTVTMPGPCSYFLDSYSSRTALPRRTIYDAGGNEVAVYQPPDPAATDELQLQPVEIHKVTAKDGAVLYGRLVKPLGYRAGAKYPAIVMVYGGPHVQTVRESWTGATWEQALAARGFAVWQLDNRGSAARGHRWESPIYHNLGAQELADQKEGVAYLQSLGFVDDGRIGIYGWSYGGFMTLYSLLHEPGLFRAGIAGAPVTDWRNYDSIYTERYMGLPAENAEGYDRSSNVKHAGALIAKLLLVHNYSDDNVHFQNTLQMADALERAGKQFDMMVYPQKSHSVTGPVKKQLLEGMTAFFERHLKAE
jgi:dipeptidyl-peptidase-4